MSTSTDLSTRETPALPAMYSRGASAAATADERAIPIVYLMADLSRPVKNGTAKPGNVIAALDPDDTEPHFLIDDPSETFRAFILDSHRYVTRGGAGEEWERLPNDYVRGDGDDDVNVGFRYAIAVPDGHFPLYSMLLIRTSGRSAFQKVNFAIDSAINRGATDPVMIEFGVTEVPNRKGQRFWKWVAKTATPTDDELAWVGPIMTDYVKAAARFQTDAPTVPVSSGAGF